MYKSVLLGLIISAFIVSGVSAQSSNKGSSNKDKGSSSRSASGSKSQTGSTETAAMKKMKRELVKQKKKMANKFAKAEFEGIKLTRDQKKVLSQLIDENYDEIVQIDTGIGNAIPANKRKALRKSYKMAQKEGMMASEAMAKSMKDVGMSEMLQQKVIDLNASKKSLMDGIRTAVYDSLNEKQKSMLAGEMSDEEMKMKDGKKAGKSAVSVK